MISQQQSEDLSKFLGIEFVYPKLRTLTSASTIFSKDNRSYISYDSQSSCYEFLLSISNTPFTFKTMSLSFKEILIEMEEYRERCYLFATTQNEARSNVLLQLKNQIPGNTND